MGDGVHVAALSSSVVDLSLWAKLASLTVLPFAHEDLAIVAGAYIIVNELIPASLVALSIYGGIVASDFALYGIGAGARRLPWLNRFAIDGRIQEFSNALRRNIFGLVVLCRVVPGVVFVAFIACGWARVSLARFTAASLLISALYLPAMLYLAIWLGGTLDDRVGFWAWPALLLALVGAGVLRKRVFAFGGGNAAGPVAEPEVPAWKHADHRGMPALAGFGGKVATAERVPPALFYAPLIANWLRLGLRYRSLTLPSVCNPAIPTGGMWGESKSDCLAQITGRERRWLADYTVLHRGQSLDRDYERARELMADAGIEFPLMAKPDIGWHGHGVRRIDQAAQLRTYLAQYPEGGDVILQQFVPHPGEAAVLYARVPRSERGGIVSIAFRYFPHVVGDGHSTLRDLIRADARARWKA
ncbi:MAG: ATP-grasp domain-containing protein, partial [Alphaproteobacteria bacterium]|nr:ATP-grasp domain-containing protein [Alphaproteobacteria bacterium]